MRIARDPLPGGYRLNTLGQRLDSGRKKPLDFGLALHGLIAYTQHSSLAQQILDIGNGAHRHRAGGADDDRHA